MSRPEDMQMVDYTGVLRRRWGLILLAAIIGAVGGIGYYKIADKTYIATAAVYVTATSQTANQVANGRTNGAVNLDTEAQVVRSVTVAQAAAKLMHSTESPQQLISWVSVTVPANSQVLSINCQASSADKAATCAQSFAQAYLAYSSASTTAATSNQISALRKQISNLQAASAKLSIEIASLPANSSQRATAVEQLNSDHGQLSSLNGQVAQLSAELADPSGGSIISNASAPSTATSPKPLLVLPSGLLAGLLIGLVLAFMIDRRDQRIRRPQDLSKLNVPVLMNLPLNKFQPELAIAGRQSPAGRGFSELAHVLIGTLGSGNHVILVTGSAAGQGTSLVAANLAVALSRSQPHVTLVCADLEGSAIPDMTGLPSGPGLTDVLGGSTPVSRVARHPSSAPRLRVITPGWDRYREAEDLQQDAVERLLVELSRDSRWVVIEGPPVQSGSDAYTLAQAADVAIVVTEVPKTRADQVADSIQHLDKMGVSVLGAVLLPSPKRDNPAAEPAAAPAAPAADVPANGTAPAHTGANGHPAAPASPEEDETAVIETPDWSVTEEAPSSLPRS